MLLGDDTYDVAVVGRGMIGSAAARHLATSGVSTVLVGPDEPESYVGDGPFSSHFDEGRVTRISASREPWAAWAAASIARYGEIAATSGIEFHDPVGLAFIARNAHDSALLGRQHGSDAHEIGLADLAQRTGISVAPDGGHVAAWEGPPAGLINPRRLVAAQTRCAELAGATVVRAAVDDLRESGSNVELSGSFGLLSARKVVLATGAYGAELAGVSLPIERRLRTVLLAELGPGPELPTMIISDPPHDKLEEAYWVPPVLYPDGRTLLKLGGDSIPKLTACSNEEITSWFRGGGSEEEATALLELLETLLPEREIGWHTHKPCVVTYTESGVPLLEFVRDRVVVALGGCGAAAKSSDEIGRLAAVLVEPE